MLRFEMYLSRKGYESAGNTDGSLIVSAEQNHPDKS
jgi:hypothetical protein